MATKIQSGLGYSPLTEKVYWGKQNPDKQMWVGEKKDVTQDFMAVAFAYFEENTVREISSGKKSNLLINVGNDTKSIERVIKELQKRIK